MISPTHAANLQLPAALPTALDVPAILRQYMRRSRADNTWRTYRAQWRRFTNWCDHRGLPPLPCAPEMVAEYLATRAQAGAAVASITVALAALRFAHKAAGLTLPLESPTLSLVMNGIRRRHLCPQRQAEPLTGDLLRQLLSRRIGAVEDLRDGALLALLYVFGLRASEVVALDWQDLGEGRGRLRILEDRAEVTLLGSKASPCQAESVVIPAADNPIALQAITDWVAHARIAPGAPVLRALTRGGGVSSPRPHVGSVGSIVKRAMTRHFVRTGLPLKEAKAKASRFSGHSGRVGLYVSAAEAGVPLQHVAALARHAGLATAVRYAERADQFKCAPHRVSGVGV